MHVGSGRGAVVFASVRFLFILWQAEWSGVDWIGLEWGFCSVFGFSAEICIPERISLSRDMIGAGGGIESVGLRR